MSIVRKLKNGIYSFLAGTRVLDILVYIVMRLFVRIFRLVATTGRGSNICLKHGFLPLPVHFYSPVPDINDLEKRDIWGKRNELRGIDFRSNEQKKLLKELGVRFSEECQWPLELNENSPEFYLKNPSFSYGCAASTHCMIRYYKPNAVVEIGSGMSSRVIARALRLNGWSKNTQYIIVDPYPSDIIKNGSLGIPNLVKKRVEMLDPSFFEQLKENDILFIDSGHCVRIGGDVNYLFLNILPLLKPGVIVHIHDVNLPYEYPKTYATNKIFRQFWTEQYLLQSFLCFNSAFEVLLAMSYLMKDHGEYFREAFPFYNPDIHPFISGSFWMRRKLQVKQQ